MANFEWYRSFVAIYREGSVSAAAQARYMTQPAISQHLAALEREVGEPLFQRGPRGMVPTERGAALYSAVAPAVEQLERITSQLRGGSKEAHHRLGAPAAYFRERLVPALAEYPGRLTVSLGESAQLVEALRAGELDVVIATQHLEAPGLQFVPLETETFRLVGGAGEPVPDWTSDPKAARIELEQRRWISYGEELPVIRRFWREAFEERPPFTAHLVVPDLHVIRELVQAGAGISVLPAYLVDEPLKAGRLKELWIPPRPVRNALWLAYRTGRRADPGLMPFVRWILERAPRPLEPR
ncbi:MAG: LysR family transcriptional regulator [Firmicutes bacterium]|nr:LysR family transcriptional regulator [Bacillota bacterium]